MAVLSTLNKNTMTQFMTSSTETEELSEQQQDKLTLIHLHLNGDTVDWLYDQLSDSINAKV
tara:strand:- start:227 stop:409 length:183 start_codon:yes stop_codon:yes gene_type:complete